MSELIPAARFLLPVARSRLVDAFSSAEAAVRRRISVLGQVSKQSLAQNIDIVLKSSASPQYSKREKVAVDTALAHLRDLQPLRCDLVHGRMEIVTIDGEKLACFTNAQKETSRGNTAFLMTHKQLEETSDTVDRIVSVISPSV